MAKSDFKVQVIQEITKQTERDKQRRVGPSQLGGCPKCLGRAMMNEDEQQEFSLYPWAGTAIHEYLEHHTFPDAQHELKLWVGDVEGYGPIKGTTDMFWQHRVVDWKNSSKKKIQAMRVQGPSNQYRYQAHLYARGCELAGLEPHDIAIVFIPRDSANVNDIWVFEEEYQPEMAEAALTRAGLVYKMAMEEGWEKIPSSDDCYTCSREW